MTDTQDFIQASFELYDNWLSPINEENPCGDDISADQDYLTLKSQCEPVVSGFASVEEKEIRWPSIFDQTNSLIEKSKDINVLMWHCRAALNVHGLVGFARALTATLATIDQYWGSIYPQLDPDDENDPFERVLALQSVDNFEGLLNDLINCILIKNNQGSTLILSNILSENHHIVPSTIDSEVIPLVNTLNDQEKSDLTAAIEVVVNLRNDVNTLLEKHTSSNNLFNVEKYEDYSKIIKKILQNVAPNDLELENDMDKGNEPNSSSSSNNTNNAIVRNRNDVEKMLDLIIAYYQKEEPSSPMPFLLRRAKGLVNKDFIEIISELSPGGANEAKSICGIIDE